MSRDIVMAVQAPFQHAYGLLERYIEVCPEDVWNEVNGGWPVWQQIYHAVTALDFFSGGTPGGRLPCDPETGSLARVADGTVSKKEVAALAAAAKARADAYIAGLEDTDLAAKNERLSQIMGMDVTHGGVVGMLASHTLYHLGSGDAALRDHGLKGVF